MSFSHTDLLLFCTKYCKTNTTGSTCSTSTWESWFEVFHVIIFIRYSKDRLPVVYYYTSWILISSHILLTFSSHSCLFVWNSLRLFTQAKFKLFVNKHSCNANSCHIVCLPVHGRRWAEVKMKYKHSMLLSMAGRDRVYMFNMSTMLTGGYLCLRSYGLF